MAKEFTPEESIAVIESMIQRTRTNFRETNKYFILWGILISAACVLEYLFLKYTDFQYYYLPWIVLPLLGWIVTIRMGIKQDYKQKTILGDAIKWVWIGFGIGFTFVFIIYWYEGANPSALMMLLSAIGTFITSRILGSTPYLLGSLILFGASIACHSLRGLDTLLVVAVAMILGYLVPAMIENRV